MSRDRATRVLKYIANIQIENPDADRKQYNIPRFPTVDYPAKPGLKQLLDAEGPEAVKNWVLQQKKLLITDTTMDVDAGLENNSAVIELGKDLAMQIAAMNPSYRDRKDVDPSVIEKEKEILLIQAKEDPKNANKPAQILEKLVQGRVGKFYEENCLLQQSYVKGDKISVEQHIAEVAKSVGGKIAVNGFTRFEKGEGIEKKQEDFAAEIASLVK